MASQQPPATGEERDLGHRGGGGRAQISVWRNQRKVEGDVDGQREEGEPGEIDLAVDRGQRIDEGVVHEQEHHRGGENAQRGDRLLEAPGDVNDGIGRDADANRQWQAEDGEHLVRLLVAEGEPAAVPRQERKRGEHGPHRGLRYPGDRVDVLVRRRVPADHLEVLEELQQDDVELRVDGRDRETERQGESGGEQPPHEGSLEPNADALVPLPAEHGKRKEAGEEVAGRIDPEEDVPGRLPIDGDDRQPEQEQRLGDDGDRLVPEATPDVEDGAKQARITRRQEQRESGQRVRKQGGAEKAQSHRQDDERHHREQEPGAEQVGEVAAEDRSISRSVSDEDGLQPEVGDDPHERDVDDHRREPAVLVGTEVAPEQHDDDKDCQFGQRPGPHHQHAVAEGARREPLGHGADSS